MTKHSFSLAGLAFGGVGLFVGIAMSSSIPGNPFVYGVAAAVYAAVAAAIIGGVQKQRGDILRVIKSGQE